MISNYAPVSVVIPCWRSMDTIERAIQSVWLQNLRPNEVILIDDASGDGSVDFLHEIAGRYEDRWIRVMSLIENRGPGIARNAGWNIAINPYVAFLDADDAWHPNKIKLQYQWMSEHPEVVMCGHGSMLLKENDSLPIIGSLPKPQVVGLYGMLWSNKIITRSVMLRRELTYRFEGKAVTEDYLLWLQMVADGLIVVKFNVPLAFSYRAEFSPGGYSGQLWRHEKRELNALAKLKQEYRISIHIYTLANIWSLVKYIRRVMKLIVAQYAKYE